MEKYTDMSIDTRKKDEESRYIDLYGYTKGILRKSKDHCVYYFIDDVYGDLLVTAKSDCVLYHIKTKGKKYHLKVILEGLKWHGKIRTRNNLIVKKVCN